MSNFSTKAAIIADTNLAKTNNIRDLHDEVCRGIQVAESYTASNTSAAVWAGSAPTSQDSGLDKIAAYVEANVENTELKVAKVTWDQSADGNLTTAGVDLGVAIPANAIIKEVVVDVLTAITGGAGDIKFKVDSTDISTAISAPGTPGPEAITSLAKDATGGNVKVYAATTAYTAGKLTAWVSYFESE